jgi:hypothetical protein
MTHKITADGAALVAPENKWIKIDATTPRGVSLLLISEHYGVAQKGLHYPNDKFFTHYYPLPTFDKKADKT